MGSHGIEPCPIQGATPACPYTICPYKKRGEPWIRTTNGNPCCGFTARRLTVRPTPLIVISGRWKALTRPDSIHRSRYIGLYSSFYQDHYPPGGEFFLNLSNNFDNSLGFRMSPLTQTSQHLNLTPRSSYRPNSKLAHP